MFNEINIGGRVLHRVCGAVLCFTTSDNIEFVDDKLTRSIPLWSGSLQATQGVSFSLTLHGFLSFKEGSQVKLIELSTTEMVPYTSNSFVIVAPADVFVKLVSGYAFNNGNADGTVTTPRIFYRAADGTDVGVEVQCENGALTPVQWRQAFPEGRPFILNPPFVIATY